MKIRRAERITLPCALAIGGIDPGGGAGILADARGFTAAGVFGCAAVAVMTVQSTAGLVRARPTPSTLLAAQIDVVLKHQRVRAIKTGALGSIANVRTVGDILAIHADIPAVVDTVMLPTRGHGRLLEERAVSALRTHLVPRAALVTVNAPEAEVLTGLRVTRLTEAHDAALALLRLGARVVLVKGGHLSGKLAVDLLAFAGEVIELSGKRLDIAPVHGGGCLLASLVAGRIAKDPRTLESAGVELLIDAARWAKSRHHALLAGSVDIGGELGVLVP